MLDIERDIDGQWVRMMGKLWNKDCLTSNPFGILDEDLLVGDLVLVREFGVPEMAINAGYEDDNPILMVYNDKEESRLHALGEHLPELPPDLHPGGYYGCRGEGDRTDGGAEGVTGKRNYPTLPVSFLVRLSVLNITTPDNKVSLTLNSVHFVTISRLR